MITNITHRNPNRAVLFSDLHYSHETEETCFQVLDFIHEQSVENCAKIYFLGDFWDHVYRRGTLPVDLLNRMIRYFKDKWTATTIMIPGNHDWFDSAETEHGLEAFHGINNIEVIDKFTEKDDLLFLPYCKDQSKIEEIVGMKKGWKCAFAHLDIVGAKMNNTRLSTKGLTHSTFDFPVYTGHYHSPSSHGNVHYIGSPYQVHLGEAGDQKSLKVIDLYTGLVYKDIPIDIGKRHFKVKSIEDMSLYREGDRVIVEEEPPEHIERELTERGVSVEIVKKPKKTSELRLKEDPTNTVEYWKKYCDIQGITKDMVEYSIKTILKSDELPSYRNNILKESIVCDIKKMRIMNFGPFVGDHVLHFEDGVTLITGTYKNKEGTDSNGAGKSLYTAGALLWGFTGKTDPRFGEAYNMSQGYIVSHGEQSASVSIYGSVNGSSFVVTRIKKRDSPCKLTFTIEDSDVGNNTIKMTQERINRRLFGLDQIEKSFDFLTRTMIWTQKKVLRFLDSSDKASKEEIANLVDIDIWDEMWMICRKLVLFGKRDISVKEREIEYEKRRMKEREERIKRMKEKIEGWHKAKQYTLDQLKEKIAKHPLGEKPEVDEKKRLDLSIKIKMAEDYLNAVKVNNNPLVLENDLKFKLMRSDRARLLKKNQEILQQIRDISALGTTCYVCSSEISPVKVATQIKELRSRMTDLVAFDEKYKQEMDKWMERSALHSKKVQEETDIKLKSLREQMKQIADQKQNLVQYELLEQQRRDWQLVLEIREKEQCPYEIPEDYASNIEQMTSELKQMKEEKKTLSFLEGHFGRNGIQSFLIESTTLKLSEKVQELCGMSFDIGHTDKERLDKKVNGEPLWLMSGGEYQRLQIACFLAYRDLLQGIKGWSSNLMVLDEPDIHVDASGVKEMMKMIVNQSKGCTIIISHTNSMHRDMSLFDRHVEIERDEKGSRKRKL